MGFLEFGEEYGAIDTIENGGSPVQNFGEIEVFQLARIGNLVEEFAKDGDTEQRTQAEKMP